MIYPMGWGEWYPLAWNTREALLDVSNHITSSNVILTSIDTKLSAPLTNTQLRASPVPVLVTSPAPLPTGATTEATLAQVSAKLTAPLITKPQTSGAVFSSVPQSPNAVTLLNSVAARRGFILNNDAGAKVYVLFGTGVDKTTNFSITINANSVYEFLQPVAYTGTVTAVWASGTTGAMRITEFI